MQTLCQFQLISGPRLLRVISFQSPGPAVLLTLTDPPPFHPLHAEREAGVGAEQLGR